MRTIFMTVYIASCLLVPWRIRKHYKFLKEMCQKYHRSDNTRDNVGIYTQNNLYLEGKYSCSTFEETLSNIWDFVWDIFRIILFPFNIIGVWRYCMMYRRIKSDRYSDWDLVWNPICTLLDLPLVCIFLMTIILSPFRIVTFGYITYYHNHFYTYCKHIYILLMIVQLSGQWNGDLFAFVLDQLYQTYYIFHYSLLAY